MASSLLHPRSRSGDLPHVRLSRLTAPSLSRAVAQTLAPVADADHDDACAASVLSMSSDCGSLSFPRPSFDSASFDLATTCSHRSSLDLHDYDLTAAVANLSLLPPAPEVPPPSLVRKPLHHEHHRHVVKVLRKLKPGQHLPAKHVRPLGKGGVGTVSLVALDMPDGHKVHLAEKKIHCKRYCAQRHAKELAAMQLAADSPFVLRVFGGSHPGRPPYAVYTEFAPLGSLHDLIAHRKRTGGGPGGGAAPYFSEEEVRWLAARVLAALAHLHGRGLVHRDISSHNIYRSASGHPLLADFDMAELVDEEGLVSGPAGRLSTAAPEVRAAAYGGGPYGRSADMWSLGMVLLEMVSDCEVQDGPELEACSEELRDLLLKGLLVHQSKRLDAEGAMRHPLFAGVDWAGLEYEVAPEGLQQEAPATGTA